MLDLINSLADGFVALPVVDSFRKRGLFHRLVQQPQTVAQLAQMSGANEGHLRVALRLLVSLGLLDQHEPDSYRLAELANVLDQIPADAVRLVDFAPPAVLQDLAGDPLRSWLERSAAGWDGVDNRIASILDGALLSPLLVEIYRTGGVGALGHELGAMSASSRSFLQRYFVQRGWAASTHGRFVLNGAGQYLLESGATLAVAVSYRPMLSRADTILFGDAKTVFLRDQSGHELHLDREMNVTGSGSQHRVYFEAFDAMMVELFDQEPLESQPKYVADMGCGDGTLLRHVYEAVRTRTLRGRHLDRYPLHLIGVDFNEKALEAASKTLHGLPHTMVVGDIGDPQRLVASLKNLGIIDPENILHVRSFLDHDRNDQPPQDAQGVARKRALALTGVYVEADGGSIEPSAAMQSLVEHLERWRDAASVYGLAILEVHCLRPATVRRLGNRTGALHFDAYHAFSGQHLVEAPVFLMAAAEAGLFPERHRSRHFPPAAPFTRITLNRFVPRNYRVRHAVESDVARLRELELASWTDDLAASQEELWRRVASFPQGQFVMEIGGRIEAALYTQRIDSVDQLRGTAFAGFGGLHDPDGKVGHLLGLCVAPERQGQGLADDLIDFVLVYLASCDGIESVAGVTRCHEYARYRSRVPSMDAYIRTRDANGRPVEPMLLFHESHGATVHELVDRFRPEDLDNNGIGVLIEYRQFRTAVPATTVVREKTAAATAVANTPQREPSQALSQPQGTRSAPVMASSELMPHIRSSIDGVLGPSRATHYGPDAPLMEIGLGSLDLLELRFRLGERVGFALEQTFLFQFGTPAAIADALQARIAAHSAPAANPMAMSAASPGEQRSVAPAPRSSADAIASLTERIRDTIESVLGDERARAYGPDTPLMGMGLTSLDLLELRFRLGERVGVTLEPTFFFQYGTPAAIVQALRPRLPVPAVDAAAKNPAAAQPTVPMSVEPAVGPQVATPARGTGPQRNERDRIAIVGLACRLPGAVANHEQFWELLNGGVDAIERRAVNHGQGSLGETQQGGFVNDADRFDASFFRISPREAELIDPQHRILLQTVWEALEQAGLNRSQLAGSDTGVFIGVTGHDYEVLLRQQAQNYERDPHFATGNTAAVASGRVAYYFDWHGPALSIDTACSSSLVAVHLACESLMAGECNVAVAGGVNLLLHADAFEAYGKAGMLAPDGRCKTFDDAANGYVRGEGCGVVVLKRLADAQRDADPIWAVIGGTAINQGGASAGLTVPNQRAQQAVIEQAVRRSGIPPHAVKYLEAHGTGTSLGDPIEVQAAAAALGSGRDESAPLLLGSVKTNIGHLEAAAGVAGLIKVVLSMRHGVIPRHLHLQTPNTRVDWQALPVRIASRAEPWPQGRKVAGVSSFGFSGSNAHVIVEEYDGDRLPATPEPGPVVVVVSARTAEQLKQQVRQLHTHLVTHEENLADLAYTLQVGREAFGVRAALVVDSLASLRHKLTAIAADEPLPEDAWQGEVKRGQEALAAFGAADLQEVIAKWLAQGRLDRLAQLWVQGLAVDWAALHGALRPRRISLPTYPFARDRYWVPQAQRQTPGSVSDEEAALASQPVETVRGVTDEEAVPLVFEERWQAQDLAGDSTTDARVLVCLLSDAQHQQAARMVLAQCMPHTRVVFVAQGEGAPVENGYRVSASDGADAYADVLRQIEATHGAIDALLHTWPLEAPVAVGEAAPLLHWLQAIGRSGVKCARVVLAGQCSDDATQAWLESWLGIERSTGLVLPDTRVTAVLARTDAALDMTAWTQRLWREIGSTQSALYVEGRRHVGQVVPLTIDDTSPGASICKPGGTYWITGGMGGLGALLAMYLAQRYQANLVLSGRGALDPARQRRLDALQALGASVLYVQADVDDEAAMRAALAQATAHFGTLDGVLHAAGVISEVSLLQQDATTFNAQLSAKVHGTRVLETVLQGQPLTFLCLFASLTAVLGDFGAAAYAMGNRYQLAHARLRAQRMERNTGGVTRGRTVAIGWPLWAEGGMQVGDAQTTQLYLKSSGQRALGSDEGLALLEPLLQQGSAQPLVILGRAQRVHAFLTRAVQGSAASATGAREPAGAGSDAADATLQRGRGYRSQMKGFTLTQCLAWDLAQHVHELLKLPREALEPETNLAEYGFESVTLMEFARRLSMQYGIEFTPSLFFSYPSLAQLGIYLLDSHRPLLTNFYEAGQPALRRDTALTGTTPRAAVQRAHTADIARQTLTMPHTQPALSANATRADALPEPIAIIGMSGRFPGARTVDELWEILRDGREVITEWPAERGDASHVKSARLGVVPGVAEFDPLFFAISPREAELMDPRQRLLLQEAWRALEDAGYGSAHLQRHTVGMFVGVEQGDYQKLAQDAGLTSNHDGILASRLAYVLDLRGPAMAINTACSSGLVATHQACQSLRSGECDTAIAAGVNLLLTPAQLTAMDQAGMLSPQGRTYAFDRRADGMVPGEAVVALVLKRLSQAQADGDPIHAVIAGSGINYDGHTNGITAPSGAAQTRLLESVYARHGIDPEALEYIVAHGTGTPLGDPIEINALADAFRPHTQKHGSCALTSSKTNLGHTLAASGLVSLVSLVQAMRHETIPASLHCEELSDYIAWDRSPLCVNRETRAWPTRAGGIRMGAVSAFGISGTNAHMVVRSYPAVQPTLYDGEAPDTLPVLLAVSAKTADALRERVAQLCMVLQARAWDGHALRAMSYTLLEGRHHLEHRCAVVVQDGEDAVYVLGQMESREKRANLFRGQVGRDFTAQKALQAYGGELLARLASVQRDAGTTVPAVQEALYALADLYCQGYELPWHTMFGATPPRRVSLPGYPFARESYWLAPQTTVRSAAHALSHLHPLVHRNTSNIDGLRFTTHLTGNEFFVTDHVVGGRHIIAGVTHLEWVRAAACVALDLEATSVQLEQVTWLRPIVVEAPLDVHVALTPEDDGHIAFELYSDHDDQLVVYSQGWVAVQPAAATPRIDVASLQAACERTVTREQYAQMFTSIGLQFGPAYQLLNDVQVGDGVAIGELRTPARDQLDGYVMPPNLLDGATQLGFALMLDQSEFKPPIAVQKLEIWSAIATPAWVVVRPAADDSPAVRKQDVTIVDRDGNVAVRLNGFSFSASAFESQAAAATMLAVPRWTPRSLEAAAARSHDNRVIVLCDIDAPDASATQTGNASVVRLASEGAPAERYGAYAGQLVELLKRRIADDFQTPTLVQLVVPASGEGALMQGLAGVLRTAQLEHPHVRGQLVMVQDTAGLAARLEAEAVSPAADVRYGPRGREERIWAEAASSEQATMPWRDQGVYWITGGLGGLGRAFAEAIAAGVRAPVLVLSGRSNISSVHESWIQKLREQGAQIEVRSVDVNDSQALAVLANDIVAQHGALHGVIHSAGVLRDNLLTHKDRAELQTVLQPKVEGLVALDFATRDIKLDWLVACSSITSVWGNVGQIDYAAANAFMDSFAQYREHLVEQGRRHGRTLSVSWPLWADGGMRPEAAAVERIRRVMGVQPLPTAAGVAALRAALAPAQKSAHVMVLHGERKRLLERLEATQAVPSARAVVASRTQTADSPVLQDQAQHRALHEAAGRYVLRLLARSLKLEPQRIDIDAPFDRYGIDSVMAIALTDDLEQAFGPLSKTLLFEYRSIFELTQYLLRQHHAVFAALLADGAPAPVAIPAASALTPVGTVVGESSSARTRRRMQRRAAVPARRHADAAQSGPLDIAIVGLAGRYPKAGNVAQFWANLTQGVDCITEIPSDRWSSDAWFDARKGTPGKSYGRWGGFLDGMAEFDPLFFSIAPSEAERMDPQERLFLQCVYHAIEDAGYTRADLGKAAADAEARGEVGVFVGVMFQEYHLHGAQAQVQGSDLALMGSASSVANRVSYHCDFHGPSIALDTMCSSSLTALHLACQSLREGNCAVAIAGGVNMMVHPNKYLVLSQLQFLSTDGRCASFGDGGDGYVPGEGVGAVVLKPLADALADGDHVYGVLKGSALNHGGKTNGYTVPNPRSQARVIEQALTQAGVHPRAVSYVEAHGTGTALGDPIEIAGLSQVFAAKTNDKQYCAIGSVKSNVGHCESAAGMAGLTKVLLQMKHRQLAGSLHSEVLNPHIDFAGTPFVVQRQLAGWARPTLELDGTAREYPRVAGLSSFGAGGSNAHLVIAEHEAEHAAATPLTGPVAVVLSARTAQQLQQQVEQLRTHLQTQDENLADLAYTLQVGREAFGMRVALVVGSLASLKLKLAALAAGEALPDDVWQGEAKLGQKAWAVFSPEDLRELIAKWLAQGRLDRLAQLWVQGLAVDWTALYGSVKPRRISLPTYPFARERYWVTVPPGEARALALSTTQQQLDAQPASGVQPLLEAQSTSGTRPVTPEMQPLCFEEEWQAQAAETGAVPTARVLVCLLSDAGHQQVAQTVLAQCAPQAQLVFIAQGPGETVPGSYRVAASASVDTYADVLRQIHADHGPIDALLHAWPLEAPLATGEVAPLLHWLQAVAHSGVTCRRVVLAGHGSDDATQAWLESWIGIERSASLALPGTRVTVVLERSDSAADIGMWVRRLWAELGSTQGALYVDGQRHIGRIVPLQLADSDKGEPLCRPGGTYWITGGMGGLGELLATHLAQHYQARLVLSGRAALDATRQRQLEALQALGASVLYVQADVSDEAAMRAALAQASARFGQLDGVIHAAGVMCETPLLQQDAQGFGVALAAKVQGTQVLEAVLSDAPSAFLCLFASVSAVLGDFGSASYAMGNRYQLAHARLHRQRGARGTARGRTVAIGWPLWADGGMHVGEAQTTRLYLQSSGQRALRSDEGLALFGPLVHQGSVQPLVLVGDARRVERFLARAVAGSEYTGNGSAGDGNDVAGIAAPADAHGSAAGKGYRPELKGLTLAQCIAWDLVQHVHELLKLPREALEPETNLADYGFESVTLMEFARRLGEHYGIGFTPSLFYSYPSLGQLAGYLLDTHESLLAGFYQAARPAAQDAMPQEALPQAAISPAAAADAARAAQRDTALRAAGAEVTHYASSVQHTPAVSQAATSASDALPEPIAIIGMSGRFPDARDIDGLWQILHEGRSVVREFPAARLPERSHDAIRHRLGAVPGVDEFDPLFFEISPREAELMDPRQRLLLQEAWRALEDAGYGSKHLKQRVTGMFVGVEQGDYQKLTHGAGVTSNHDGVLASRLAYVLDLQGPAMAINTACSSGLVAAHQACLSLRAGECDTAIVAAVNLLLTPSLLETMEQAGMLSAQGICRAFDRRADGMVSGEAVVALVLRRLSQAQADGDPIHAVIAGSGINYDGHTNGITAPSGAAQTRLLRTVYARHGIDARQLDYIVTHGTGTPLGDPIEINALNEAFSALTQTQTQTQREQFCALGSTKPNVGHTLAASGLVSLVSLVQAMRHATIPASVHCEQPSDYIEWARSPFHVNRQARAWPARADGSRMGAVSAFGISGTNAHMVVRAHVAQQETARDAQPVNLPVLLAVAAKTAGALRERIAQLRAVLEARDWDGAALRAMSHTLLEGRQHFRHRCAVVVQDRDDALYVLGEAEGREKRANLFRAQVGREFTAQKALQGYGAELLVRVAAMQYEAGDAAQAAYTTQPMQEALYALADLYCQGYELPWAVMFGATPPRRISLPGYPFERETYWFTAPVSHGNAAAAAHRLHPLVHRNTSDLRRQRYTTTLRGDEFYLRDHIVQERPIVPGVVQLEWARAAAQLALGGTSAIELRQVNWVRPLVVEAPLDVQISLTLEDDGRVRYEIHQDGDQAQVYSRGWALVAAESSQVDAPRVDLQALRATCGRSMPGAEIYSRFAAAGLYFGPSFQTLAELRSGDGVAIGTLNWPADLPLDAYTWVPSMLDGALQTIAGFEQGELRLALPFALQAVEQWSPLPREAFAVAQRTAPGDAGAGTIEVAIVAADGRVALRLSGFTTWPAPPRDTQRERVGDLTLAPVWEPAEQADTDAPSSTQRVVRVGAASGSLASLPCVEWDVSDSRETLAERLKAVLPLEHVIWAVPADEPQAALMGLRLIQAVLALDYGLRPLRMTVLTRQAQAVHPNEDADPLHAGIHGLIGSLAKEYPHWRVSLIDLPRDVDLPADLLFAQPTNARGAARVWRAQRWHQQRLAPCALPVPHQPAFREGGVYVVLGGAGGIGLVLSEHLIRHYRAQLVWLGRRAEDDTIAQQRARLGALGPTPLYLQADGTDRDALERADATIRARFGALHGAVHAAIVLADSSLANMRETDFTAGWSAKVETARQFADVFGAHALDAMLFFGSVQSFMKMPGQSNYAAGCCFVDAFAHGLRGRPYPVKVMQWGYWGGVGVAAADSYRERAARVGFGSVEPAEAMAALERLMASTIDQLVFLRTTRPEAAEALMGGPQQSVTVLLPQMRSRTAPARLESTAPAAATPRNSAPKATAMTRGGLVARIERALAELIVAQLKLALQHVERDAPLSELGFDSITLTAFGATLNERYGLGLTPTIFFEAPTIAALAEHLVGEHQQAMSIAFGETVVDVPRPQTSEAADAAPRTHEPLTAPLERILTGLVVAQLKIAPEHLDKDAPLSELGFDSISLTAFGAALNERYGLALTPTVFFEAPTLAALACHLVQEYGAQLATVIGGAASPTVQPASRAGPGEGSARAERVPAARAIAWPLAQSTAQVVEPARRPEPIAVIGISGSFPGAPNLDALWANLEANRDSIGELPPSRWSGSPAPANRYAGVIPDVETFDPLFFGISPREAAGMDPQQRLLMTYVYLALEDAGYSVSSLSGSQTALIVGTGMSGYGQMLEAAGASITGTTAAGLAGSMGPNRMSYWLNWHGPSEPVDTACSSSLVAVHRAVNLLRSGQCEQAMVGGVNSLLSIQAQESFMQAGMLSADGRCKTFSAQANGYVRGEGVAMLFLKPLAAAERDGDHIYGVILGSAEGHGGRANSLTAPNPVAQAQVIARAFGVAGIEPGTVGYIEAHGTGTALGDPIEMQGLKRAFKTLCGDATLPAASIGVSSIKSNIGHLEFAAGVAGLIKVLLQMKHRRLVASLHCDELNPRLELDGSPFHVVTSNRPWPAPNDASGLSLPRRAGVSSFGFGGVNAHVVVEEYPAAVRAGTPLTGPVAVVLSARTAEQLRAQAQLLLAHLQTHEVNLADLAYTLQVGREAFGMRLALVVTSIDTLKQKMQALENDESLPHDVWRGEVKRHQDTLAIFDADADLQQVIGKWLEEGKVGKLAELWVRGLAVDWPALYRAPRPRRISLPTYPFAKERYWVPETAAQAERVPASAARQGMPPGQREPGRPTHAQAEMSGSGTVVQQPKQATPAALEEPAHLTFERTTSASGRTFYTGLPGKPNVAAGESAPQYGLHYLDIALAAGRHAAQRDVHGLKNLVWGKPADGVAASLEFAVELISDDEDVLYRLCASGNDQEPQHVGELMFDPAEGYWPEPLDVPRALARLAGASMHREGDELLLRVSHDATHVSGLDALWPHVSAYAAPGEAQPRYPFIAASLRQNGVLAGHQLLRIWRRNPAAAVEDGFTLALYDMSGAPRFVLDGLVVAPATELIQISFAEGMQ